jgi:hypothetical protein
LAPPSVLVWRPSVPALASASWPRVPRKPSGRQPSAAAQITGAVQLPLFLLEGVAVIAEVVALLIVLKSATF